MDGIPAREFYILRKRIIFVIWYFFEAGAPNVPLFGTIGAKKAENDANVPLFGTIGALRGDINLFWGKNIFRVVKSK